MAGCLFVVSTPIGNLDDMTVRARIVLQEVDWVACEDTRHSGNLLAQLGISARLLSYHEHNERDKAQDLVARLEQGQTGALISDAGTPLISDPGYVLVRACQDAGIQVVPVPGASAILSALVVSGMPTDQFLYQGFLPAKGAARQQAVVQVLTQPMTTVVYEAPHRLLSLLEAMSELEPAREVALCRELTKRFETILRLPVADLLERVKVDADQLRGEMVLVVSPAPARPVEHQALIKLAELLVAEMPASKAAKVLAAWSGEKRQDMYRLIEAL